MVWTVPVAAVLAICAAVLRKADADFRRRRPVTFLIALAGPIIIAGCLALFVTGLVLGNSDSPEAAYKALFEEKAEDCTSLLFGKTHLTTDAEFAEVVFRSTCPGIAASLEKFNLRPAPENSGVSLGTEARQLVLAEPDCPAPIKRIGAYGRWREVETVECAAHGLYAIGARWID
ncbi:MAG: hypothetical protein R3C46_05870 [Hyphomonadaceae bacterium]